MLPFQKQKKHNNTFILQVRLFKGERWNTPPPQIKFFKKSMLYSLCFKLC